MMNDEWRIWRGFLENPIIFFSHSPFSPVHLFFNFPKLLNSYFLSFPSRSAIIRVYLRQKNPFLFSIFSFSQLSSSFLFQTAKLLRKFQNGLWSYLRRCGSDAGNLPKPDYRLQGKKEKWTLTGEVSSKLWKECGKRHFLTIEFLI